MSAQLYAPIPPNVQSPRERYAAIITHAAHSWGVTAEQVMGRSRKWPITEARWACCEALAATGLSSVRVGRLMGLDPSSVRYALVTLREVRK